MPICINKYSMYIDSDIIKHILTFLTGVDIINFIRVCKRIHDIGIEYISNSYRLNSATVPFMPPYRMKGLRIQIKYYKQSVLNIGLLSNSNIHGFYICYSHNGELTSIGYYDNSHPIEVVYFTAGYRYLINHRYALVADIYHVRSLISKFKKDPLLLLLPSDQREYILNLNI